MDDDQLARNYLAGDKKAFEGLYSRYRGLVYSIAYKYLRDPELAKDVVQDSFIKAERGLGSYVEYKERTGQASFKTWIYTITARLCRDEKVKRYHNEVCFENVDFAVVDPFSLTSSDLKEKIQFVFQKMRPNHREVLNLFYFERLSYREIAERLEVTPTNVMNRLFGARQAFRKQSEGIISLEDLVLK